MGSIVHASWLSITVTPWGSPSLPMARIEDLESEIHRLRNRQEMLKRKLRKQAEKKSILEVRERINNDS